MFQVLYFDIGSHVVSQSVSQTAYLQPFTSYVLCRECGWDCQCILNLGVVCSCLSWNCFFNCLCVWSVTLNVLNSYNWCWLMRFHCYVWSCFWGRYVLDVQKHWTIIMKKDTFTTVIINLKRIKCTSYKQILEKNPKTKTQTIFWK